MVIGLLSILSGQSQEIIPFPDLSEHYNFRNSGGESALENPYEHLDSEYQKALEVLDKKIAAMELRLRDGDKAAQDVLLKEFEALQAKRLTMLKEAELHSDLLLLH